MSEVSAVDLGQEMEPAGAGSETITPAIERPTRPVRTARPAAQRRVLKPLVLDQPIEDAETDADAPKPAARPVRPERRVLDGMEEEPRPARPTRRARVLEPDQIAASRQMPETPPSSVARDAVVGMEDAGTSKLGGVMQAFAQIGGRLKKAEAEEFDADDAVAPKEDEQKSPKVSAVTGIASKITSRFQKSKDMADTDEAVVALYDDAAQDEEVYATPRRESVLARSKAADELAQYQDEFEPMMQASPAASAGILARLDTTAMGIAAGIGVSCVGLILVSTILG